MVFPFVRFSSSIEALVKGTIYIYRTSGVQMLEVWSACCNMRRPLIIDSFAIGLLFPIDRGKGVMQAAWFTLCEPKSQIDGIRTSHDISFGIKMLAEDEFIASVHTKSHVKLIRVWQS